MFSRRDFVKGAAATGLVTLIEPAQLFAQSQGKQIGIQLYTIRDIVNKDFIGTMEHLVRIGYNTIETAGYSDRKFYGYVPEEFKSLVTDIGVSPISSHSGITSDNIEETIEDAIKAGMKYIVLPSLPSDKRESIDSYKKVADEMNAWGELCKKSGLTFAYHNHAFEFEKIDNLIPYDIMLENTDPELVTMQLDTYWMVYGGYEPIDYFNKYPGRFKLWHVKDMVKDDTRESTEIGSGRINFVDIFNSRKKAGMEYIFLEQEEFKMDIWKSLTISYKSLNKLPQ